MRKRTTVAVHSLTPRERQIVRLVAEGRSNAEIAGLLSLRTQTVKNRVGVIFEKVGVSSRLELRVPEILT